MSMKRWEIAKAIDEGREVSIDGVEVTHCVIRFFEHAAGGEVYRNEMSCDVEITPAMPTEYTLEEAAAALVRGERVLCGDGEVVGFRRSVGGELRCAVTVHENDHSTTTSTYHVADIECFYPAPPEPSIEELMRAHDPVGNPTVICRDGCLVLHLYKTANHRYPYHGSRLSANGRSLSCGTWSNQGAYYHDRVDSLDLIPSTEEADKARYAEWAKGQQS